MRRLFRAILCLTAAAAALLGFALFRSRHVHIELGAQLDARRQIDEFIAGASLAVPWTRGDPLVQTASEPEEPPDGETVYGLYEAPEGFLLVSHAKAWDDAMMKRLYDELMRNAHGQEIRYLNKVVVHAGAQVESVLGMQQESASQYAIRLYHQTLLPPGMALWLVSRASTIHLYNGDNRTTVEEMAATLSHEYGHHFTNYYFFDGDSSGWLDTRYAQLRGLPPGRVRDVIDDTQSYLDNHRWYIQEIAAEDYVVLMGSPATRRTILYCDTRDWLLSDIRGQTPAGSGERGELAFNALPHENLSVPFPTEVSGLREYFYSFVSAAPPEPHPQEAIEIAIRPQSRGYNLVGGYTEFAYFEIEWNCPYPQDALYTLICCDENDEILAAVKSVLGGEDAKALIGNVPVESGKLVYSLNDHLAEGTRRFRVVVVLSDGWVTVSDPLEYGFGG